MGDPGASAWADRTAPGLEHVLQPFNDAEPARVPVRGASMGDMRRSRRASGSVEVVCARHGSPTQLKCARCEKPICPRCLVPTPVGFMCDDHPGTPVKRAEDLPLTSRFRPLGRRTPQPSMTPMIGLLLFPLMLLLGPLLGVLTGGSAAGVFLLPAIVLAVLYLVMRRRR